MDLPQTLHGQVCLLAYDRDRGSFDSNDSLVGFTLRAAMLTDLYLTGYLEDEGGKPHPSSDTGPADPVLRAEFDRIGVCGRDWSTSIAEDPRQAIQVVRDQLQAAGWLHVRQLRRLGFIPTTRLQVYDGDMVDGLADRTTGALYDAVEGRQADPRMLAVGMLGVLGQLPAVGSFTDSSRHRQQLRELIPAAIEPIVGLQQAVLAHLEDQRSSGSFFNPSSFSP